MIRDREPSAALAGGHAPPPGPHTQTRLPHGQKVVSERSCRLRDDLAERSTANKQLTVRLVVFGDPFDVAQLRF
jgi:hypothetical protein